MGRKKAAESQSNGFDATRTPEYVGRIEDLQNQIDDIMAAAQKQCGPMREDIAAIKKEANENDNIPRKELNATVRKRRLLAKAESIRGALSEAQQDNFDSMWDTLDDLDDTPLGRAARKSEGEAAH